MGTILNEGGYGSSILPDGNDDSMERNKKEMEYHQYIVEHINNVVKAYNMYFLPLLEKTGISDKISDQDLKIAIEELGKTIDTHDASKFSDSEFYGYRAKYYPTQKEKNGDDEYQRLMEENYRASWKHHYTVNLHHAKHFYDEIKREPIEDMPLRYIIEMLCDWEAMSMKFNDNTIRWYEEDAKDEKSYMTVWTRAMVEELLYNVVQWSKS